ncbi:thiamine pyrophosphokinase [Melghirimyces profundicolus]|uniref:Thiamine diphosphokinase n=1 Tax=Melghirimyces profundicolus TaxID=1242148 RepID=A0A2T6BYS3_9BACL|nr:thiamine diphosphokinase [Melghirimyces profundicolus]PTX61231.1 thiamine pyrophosphokinase [Melghirimyces profundicolus]
MKRWVIVAGGDLEPADLKELRREDRVIAVDGGVLPLLKAELPFDRAVGDFDTLSGEGVLALKKRGIRVEELPAEKDVTDTQYAVEQALAEGAGEILILGALGGSRFDHSLANVFLLEKVESAGVRGEIRNSHNRLRLYTGNGREMIVERGPFQYVSLLPLSERVEDLHLKGFRYPLAGATLLRSDPMGISNKVIAPRATIRASSGRLLVVESSD